MQNTVSVINLAAIYKNARYVRGLIGKRFFFAVVKANAYGHGAVEVARAIEGVVDGFCVAIVDEGAQLRVAGITKPILVLAPPQGDDDIARMSFYNLQATVVDIKSAKLAKNLSMHIAVNTGMNRYGASLEELPALLKNVNKENVVGLYSHLFAPENDRLSQRQLNLFERANAIVKTHCPRYMPHLSASGGILRGGKYLFGGVRCGLMLYGYAPAGFKCENLTPALKVYAPMVQSTKFIGGGVGYNIADKAYENLYTYRLGYADGFARGVPLGEKTLCMDAFISVEKSDFLPVFTNADEYAKRCKTISYEALCRVTARSRRIYER